MTTALFFWGSGGQDLLPLGKVDALAMVDTLYQAESEVCQQRHQPVAQHLQAQEASHSSSLLGKWRIVITVILFYLQKKGRGDHDLNPSLPGEWRSVVIVTHSHFQREE